MDALGTTDPDFRDGILDQIVALLNIEDDTHLPFNRCETELNFIISVIKNNRPKDELHAMLLAQMAINHRTQLRFAGDLFEMQRTISSLMKELPRSRMKRQDPWEIENEAFLKESLARLDSTSRSFEKLARTYTMQLDGSKRYARNEPSITVRHVSGNDGQRTAVHVPRDLPHEVPNNGHKVLLMSSD
jgi:hypothetical protein